MNKKVKFQSQSEILELYNYEMNTEHLFLTIGREGSAYTNGKEVIRQRTFESEVVDTIGAGDTYYAFACLMSSLVNVDKNDIMLIPSLAASLSTTWLCNEKSVTPQTLIEHANRFIF